MKRLSPFVAVFLFAACGSTNDVGSRFVKSQDVGTAGGVISVSQADEPKLAGTRLEIPAHALSQTTHITLELFTDSLSADGIGPVAGWAPDGLSFATPAHLTLPLTVPSDVESDDIYVNVLEGDGTSKTISAVTVSGQTASFDIAGFTSFQMSAHHCSTNADCSVGKTCVLNRCRIGGTDGGGGGVGGGGGSSGVGGGGGSGGGGSGGADGGTGGGSGGGSGGADGGTGGGSGGGSGGADGGTGGGSGGGSGGADGGTGGGSGGGTGGADGGTGGGSGGGTGGADGGTGGGSGGGSGGSDGGTGGGSGGGSGGDGGTGGGSGGDGGTSGDGGTGSDGGKSCDGGSCDGG